MKQWMRTIVTLVLVLAIAAGGFFLPNLVSARLDRTNQDATFSLSTGGEQGAASILRRKLTDGMQNLFYGEDAVELDESAAAHTLAEIEQYAQDFLEALEKDSALFGNGFTMDAVAVRYASYGSGFALWEIGMNNARGDEAGFLLDDATGCILACTYVFSADLAFQIKQNNLWDYLLRVFENRIASTITAALGVTYDEVQIPVPEAAYKLMGQSVRGANSLPLRPLNSGNTYDQSIESMDSSVTDYLQFYDPDADVAFSLPAWRVENTLYFNAQ